MFVVFEVIIAAIIVIAIIGLLKVFTGQRIQRREAYILSFQFPVSIKAKVLQVYPHLTESEIDLVMQGLRDYFQVCNLAGNKMVSMPSQVVDVAWHEFILFTRNYALFCQQGLGRFLHHTPAEAMTSPTIAQEGIKRAWRFACKKDRIDPNAAFTLPLLFAIDAKLQIADGFTYHLNCQAAGASGYCAGHIGCGGGSGDGYDSSDSSCGGSSCSSCGGGD
ncbi:hypothetical protein K1M91_15095 [Motilimonas sp. E26]|nr:hypothetical protein [Motilimonas sp. E26]MCE0558292.1 hypothetical protein [Motilimonas sp. E26]